MNLSKKSHCGVVRTVSEQLDKTSVTRCVQVVGKEYHALEKVSLGSGDCASLLLGKKRKNYGLCKRLILLTMAQDKQEWGQVKWECHHM